MRDHDIALSISRIDVHDGIVRRCFRCVHKTLPGFRPSILYCFVVKFLSLPVHLLSEMLSSNTCHTQQTIHS